MSQADVLIPVHTNGAFHTNELSSAVPMPMSSANTRDLQISASAFSTNSASFSVDFSDEQVVDREVLLCLDGIKVRFTAGTDNRDVNYDTIRNFIFKAWPLASCMKNLTVQINNSSLSVEPQLWQNALNSFNSDDYLEGVQAPCFPNTNSSFVNMVRTGLYDPRCPTNNKSRWGRANFPIKIQEITAKGANTKQTIEVTFPFPIAEPLCHPFFNQSLKVEGLKRVKSMRVDVVWVSNLANALFEAGASIEVRDTAGAVCTVDANYPSIDTSVSNLKLLMKTYIPSTKVPPVVSHPYREIIVKPLTFTMANSTDVVSGSISLPAPPSQLMFFCRPTADNAGYTSVDRLAQITKFTLNTPKNSGLYSGSTVNQLFEISKRNGLNSTLAQWFSRGSVLMLDIGRGDVPSYWANSLGENFTFDYSATVNPFSTVKSATVPLAATEANGILGYTFNIAGALTADVELATTYTMYCIAIYDRQFVTDGASCVLTGGYMKDQMLKAIQSMDKVHDVDLPDGAGILSGGSFKSFWNTVRKPLGVALKVGSSIVPNPIAGKIMATTGSVLGAGQGGSGGGALLRG